MELRPQEQVTALHLTVKSKVPVTGLSIVTREGKVINVLGEGQRGASDREWFYVTNEILVPPVRIQVNNGSTARNIKIPCELATPGVVAICQTEGFVVQ